MSYKGFPADERIIVPVADLLHNRLEKVTYKKGFSAKDIVSDHGNSRVYSTVLFKLLELMIMDVIAGYIVYFDKEVKSMFYVDFMPATQEIVDGKGIKKELKTPLVDLSVTKYRMPFIAFDPGYKRATPCKCIVPTYLYSTLVNEVNKGRKFPKSNKDFWINKKK